MQKRHLIALGTTAAMLAACSAAQIDGPAQGAGAAAGTSGGSAGGKAAGGAAGKGAGGSGAGSSAGPGGVTCAPGIPTTSQVPRMLNRMYDNAVRDLLGVTALSDGSLPSGGLFSDFDGPMTADAWRLYQDVGAKIAAQVMSGANKPKFISCDPAATNCLNQTIQAFGRKAFRRPMTPDEVTNFRNKLSQTTPAGTPAQIAEAALFAFLVSPSFLLIPELSQTKDTATGTFELSSNEVAARLSFLLWGSVPDDELNTAADQNMLQTKDQILTQARRMIAVREKTGPLVSAFHRVAWAQDNGTAASHWWKMDHDGNALYKSTLKETYRQEIDLFFEDVAFSGGSFADLFLSPTAFVSKDTAAIYGLDPSGYGTDLTKVTLDKTQRPGFMTRIGFLSSYAHASETSPILRGAFVTVHMIGLDPGPPKLGAAQTPIPPGKYSTMREEITALVNTSNDCKGCHEPYVNPPGFVLENYDSIGKWQTIDPLGGAIDPIATVSFSDTDVRDVKSSLELMQGIAATPAAKAIYAQTWVSFAFGRSANPNDQCVADELDAKLSKDGYTVLDMLADVTQADSFRLRAQATP